MDANYLEIWIIHDRDRGVLLCTYIQFVGGSYNQALEYFYNQATEIFAVVIVDNANR